MSKDEKLLLLSLLMRDIRGAFPNGNKDPRLLKVLELSKELDLDILYNETKDWIGDRYLDGRFFRDCEMNYNEIDKMHNLKPTYKDKSKEFIYEADIIEYKEYIFKDYVDIDTYYEDLKNWRNWNEKRS